MFSFYLQSSIFKRAFYSDASGPTNNDIFLFIVALLMLILIFCTPYLVRSLKEKLNKSKDITD